MIEPTTVAIVAPSLGDTGPGGLLVAGAIVRRPVWRAWAVCAPALTTHPVSRVGGASAKRIVRRMAKHDHEPLVRA